MRKGLIIACDTFSPFPYQQTPQQFSKAYEVYANKTGVQTSLYGPFGFDAAWLVAIALNSSIKKLSNPGLLNVMDVREDNATETIKDSLLKARFPGLTVSMHHELHREYAPNQTSCV